MSDQSDEPPARPPLPPEHMYVKREGSHSSVERTSSKHSNGHSHPAAEEITEELIVPETRRDDFQPNDESRDCLTSLGSSEESKSVFSDHNYHQSNCELSKRVSMSLKDLIRIHEKEIARVSGAFSTRALDKIEETTRKTSITREHRKSQDHAKWKRHTTIGLLGNFSNGATNDLNDAHTTVSDSHDHQERLDDCYDNQSEREETSPMSPIHTTKKMNITVVTKTTSDCSEPVAMSPTTPQRGLKSPPSTLPKPKKVTTSSMVTSPLHTVVSPRLSPQANGHFHIPTGTSFTSGMSDSGVQTEERLVRSPSFRRNESRVKELTEENEKMKQAFEEERKQLNKKLQEQTKLANAYQKLEDRYRKKVYDLQKAIKTCTCANGRYATYPSRNHGDVEHYR